MNSKFSFSYMSCRTNLKRQVYSTIDPCLAVERWIHVIRLGISTQWDENRIWSWIFDSFSKKTTVTSWAPPMIFWYTSKEFLSLSHWLIINKHSHSDQSGLESNGNKFVTPNTRELQNRSLTTRISLVPYQWCICCPGIVS